MNIYELNNVLSDLYIPALVIEHEYHSNPLSNNISILFRGLGKFRFVTNQLAKTRAFDHIIGPLLHTSIYTEDGDEVSVSQADGEQILNLANKLQSTVTALKEFLDSNLNDPDQSTIKIRIPDADDFDDLAKFMNDFKKALSIPIRHPGVDGSLKILRGEPGSIWLVVLVIGPYAAKLIAELCWSGTVIRKKHLEGDFVHEQVREYKLNNDAKEAVLKAQTAYLDALVEVEAKGIINRLNLQETPEFAEQLKMSIRTLDELFKKGAEIRPSLGIPEETANLFPNKENNQIAESRIKQITEGDIE